MTSSQKNSLKTLKIAIATSKNPPIPHPIAVNAFRYIHSSFFCPTKGKGRGTYTILEPIKAIFEDEVTR